MANPFDSNPFVGTTKEAEITEEATLLLNAAKKLEGNARLARKNGDWTWLESIKGLAAKLANLCWEIFKKAVILAVFNGISEICTMTLNLAMESLTKHKATGPIRPAPVTPPPAQSYGDPFQRNYGTTTW